MHAVWKYTIPVGDGDFEVEMPRRATLLSAQAQNGEVCLWALVTPTLPKEKRTFRIFGTGHPIPPLAYAYVGTVQMEGGKLVWHLFERISPTAVRGRVPA